MFEIRGQRTGNVIQRSVGLAGAAEVHMRNTVGIFDPAIAGEAVEHKRQPLVALHTDRTLEIFIENRADDIAR